MWYLPMQTLQIKRNFHYRLVLPSGGEGWVGSLGLAMPTIIYRMDKQKATTGKYIQKP